MNRRRAGRQVRTEDGEFSRRVLCLTAGLVGLAAAGGWLLGGTAEALGALAGGLIASANFAWLRWMAGIALRGAPPTPGRSLRTPFWVAATCARFGVIGLAVGLATWPGGLGVAGLLVAFTALPVSLVVEGLRLARVA